LSTTTTPKLKIKTKSEAEQLTSSQFHKDILLNLQKKSYFYKLINVYPFLFPECCRVQCDCCTDQLLDRLNQTIHSEREFFSNKSRPIKPCVHSFSCDYDLKYDDLKYETKLDAELTKNDDSKHNSIINDQVINSLIKQDNQQQQHSTGKNVEFKINDSNSLNSSKQQNNNPIQAISPTTSTLTTSTTTTSATNSNNHRIALKPLPNKSVGQSLISSFVQLEPGTYFRHMKLKRDSISYRSAMLNTPRYRLKASSCPDIYKNSLLSLNRDHSKTNLFSTLKYFICDIFDTSLLQDYRFALFCVSNSCLYACIDVPYIYMPEYAIQKKTSEKMASYLISVIGIVNTLGIVSPHYKNLTISVSIYINI